jgi:hypothetical protein
MHRLPGVINVETVHSLNLSTDLRYLFGVSAIKRNEQKDDIHCAIFPHDLFYHVQTGIGNHLDDMAVLSGSDLNPTTLGVRLRCARCTGECSQGAGEGRSRPTWEVGSKGGNNRWYGFTRIVCKAVQRCIGWRQQEEMVRHGRLQTSRATRTPPSSLHPLRFLGRTRVDTSYNGLQAINPSNTCNLSTGHLSLSWTDIATY